MPLPNANLDTTMVEVPLRLLKSIEWQHDKNPAACPCCGEAYKYGHKSFCELGKAIADATTDVRIQPE